MEGGLAEAGERRGPFGVPGWGERERPLEAREGGGGVEAEGAFPGEAEEAQRGCLQLGCLLGLPGGVGEVEGGRVVVGEHVGQVFDPLGRLRLDPGGGSDVPGGAGGPGELVVGDVAGEDVPEGVLGLALHRRLPRRTDELLARQLAQRAGHGLRVALAHRRHGTGPEHLADHRRVRQQRLRVRLEGVQAGGDQRLHRLRERHLRALPAAPSSEPFRTSRSRSFSRRTNSSAYSGLPPARSRIGCCNSAGITVASSRADTRRAVSSWESGARLIGVDVAEPRRVVGVALVQLRPGRADEQQGDAFGEVGQVLEEGEHRLVGPVQVLEHEHGRVAPRRPPPGTGARP